MLEFGGPTYQSDKDVVLCAIKEKSTCWHFASKTLQQDLDVLYLYFCSKTQEKKITREEIIEYLPYLDVDFLDLYSNLNLEKFSLEQYTKIFEYHVKEPLFGDFVPWSLANYMKEYMHLCILNGSVNFGDENIFHMVSRRGYLDLVKLAMDRYPELRFARNRHQKTCLNIAKSNGYHDLARFLSKSGVKSGRCKFKDLNYEFVCYICTYLLPHERKTLKRVDMVFEATFNLESSWRRKVIEKYSYFAPLIRESWRVTYFSLWSCSRLKSVAPNATVSWITDNSTTETAKDLLMSRYLLDSIERHSKDIVSKSPFQSDVHTVELVDWNVLSLPETLEILQKQENGILFISCFTNTMSDLNVNSNPKYNRGSITPTIENPISTWLGKSNDRQDSFFIKIQSSEICGLFEFFELPPQDNQRYLDIKRSTDIKQFVLCLDPLRICVEADIHMVVVYQGRIEIDVLSLEFNILYQGEKLGFIEMSNIGVIKAQETTELDVHFLLDPIDPPGNVVEKIFTDYSQDGRVKFEFDGFITVRMLMTTWKYPIQFTQEKIQH